MTDPRIEAAARAICSEIFCMDWNNADASRKDECMAASRASLAAADAADPLNRVKGPLWCVTIAGPDEVHAVADYATGVRKARELNVWLEKNNKTDENAPIIYALVDEWQWDAESHAEDIARQEKEEAAMAKRRERSAQSETITIPQVRNDRPIERKGGVDG
ncbi:MAG: hypothetical protein ABF636_06375 [Acetobacter sp.]